jgi:hypothetical protein
MVVCGVFNHGSGPRQVGKFHKWVRTFFYGGRAFLLRRNSCVAALNYK